MRIGYLGPAGSHSQVAAEMFAQRYVSHGDNTSLLPVPMMSFRQILDAVDEGALDLACVPVENALEGSVGEVLDSLALKLSRTQIVAEFVMPIQHALIRKYEFMEGIAFVHSHPQAIGQCRDAVYELFGTDVKFIPAASTSEAVKALLTLDETHAAIGSCKAAQHYGLEVLIENLGNNTRNATRFLVLSSQSPQSLAHLEAGPGMMKTSLCLGMHENKPGALLEVLMLFAEHQLNMSKIESRPAKKSLGDYLFYVDIEGTVPVEVMQKLEAKTSFLRCLGVYPSLGQLSVDLESSL